MGLSPELERGWVITPKNESLDGAGSGGIMTTLKEMMNVSLLKDPLFTLIGIRNEEMTQAPLNNPLP